MVPYKLASCCTSRCGVPYKRTTPSSLRPLSSFAAAIITAGRTDTCIAVSSSIVLCFLIMAQAS